MPFASSISRAAALDSSRVPRAEAWSLRCMSWSRLVDLDIVGADYLTPAFAFLADAVGKFLGRARGCCGTDRVTKLELDTWVLDRLRNGGAELVDNRGRRALRGKQAVEAVNVEIR